MLIQSFSQASDYIDRLVELTIEDAAIPGIALAITDRDRTLKAAGYGLSDIAHQTRVTPGTVFEIGSLGKPFTVIPLLQLSEAGELDLRSPVARYLPWFEVRSAHGPITVHHLLNHTAGLVRGNDIAPYGLYESWALRNLKTNCPPGEFFWYSNVGYKTLGFLIERLCEESLAKIITSRVLKPLGMTHTYPATVLEMRGKTATGYTSLYDDRPEHPSQQLVPAIWAEYATGDGAQASTVEDMTAYLRMLLNRGRGPGGQLISEESFNLMTDRGVWTGSDYYGYGLVTYDVDGRTYIGHGGGNSGFRAALVVDMQAGLGVVLLVNKTGDTNAMVDLAQQALSVVQQATDGPMPPGPTVRPDPAFVPDALEYAGTYRAGKQAFRLAARAGRLLMEHEEAEVALERRAADSFYVPHPDFELSLLDFGRESGKVVEAFHGSDWYRNVDYAGPQHFEYPVEWDAYCGHYRARNPELSNFRVVVRKDALVLLNPWGNTEPLIPLEPGLFRVGADPCVPEILQFSAVVEGQALRADYSGCPYYRTFSR